MKIVLQYIVILVVVTSLPRSEAQYRGTGVSSQIAASTTKIIRFLGNSLISYDFNILTAEMLGPAAKESISMQFFTDDTDGLMWFFNGANGHKMHISVKDGNLLFVNDDGSGLPQQVVLQKLNGHPINDLAWHSIRVEKQDRTLKFYIDNEYITQITTQNDIQFVSRGELFLGGSRQTSTDTGGLINSNYDGAVTDVESHKFTAPTRELIVSFLQFVESAKSEGNVVIINREEWNRGNWSWRTTAPPTQPPDNPTPVTFTSSSSMFYLRDPLDMRSGGSFGFRFRTLEERGLMAMAEGSGHGSNFLALEMFDGVLYFVYDLGNHIGRKTLSDRRMDDGEWHDINFKIEGNQQIISLDGQNIKTPIQAAELRRMYFYRLWIGGYDDFSRAPWALYSREGYRGCLELLKVNDIGVDLHRMFRDNNLQGVEVGCRSFAQVCQSQPCVSGYCRDRMQGYVCDCSNTPHAGKNCDNDALIASWDGTKSTEFEFLNREVTHTNDISFRFLTPLSDTFLFETETDHSGDFIRAQLVNGVMKVTIKAGSITKSFQTGTNLNDHLWHTLYVRRRADDVEIWVDDEPKSAGLIGGADYKLQIDRIRFASAETGALSSGNYIGYMQNFMYEDRDIFQELRKQTTNVNWIMGIKYNDLTFPPYKPVTVTSSSTYFQLTPLRIGMTMRIMFQFKTREPNGLILYSSGTGRDAIALELNNGLVRLAYNLGGGRNMFTEVDTPKLNDNKWHAVQVALNDQGQFTIKVDSDMIDVTTGSGDNRLDLAGPLYIAGLPANMYTQPKVMAMIQSRQGFRGCLASVDLNGQAPTLGDFASDKKLVFNGCTDLAVACKPNVCAPGVCMPGVDGFWCDCNMTGYAGTPCNQYPIGYYFGKSGEKGILVYEFPFEHQASSNLDRIALGFMTREADGVLTRLESSRGDEYIELRLVNGHVIAESRTGQGRVKLTENSRRFDDGQYHVVRYIRTGRNSTLQVDNNPMQSAHHSGSVSLFDKVYKVLVGGRTDSSGAQMNNFYGIIGGAHWNNYRWLDMYESGQSAHGNLVVKSGNVVLANPYILVARSKPTPAPPDIFIPPGGIVPENIGGGGIVGTGIGGTGDTPGVIGIGGPGGLTGLTGGAGINVPAEPITGAASALVGPAPPPMATGARAGAVVGTVLGTMAFMSSLMWALYKLKPGVPTCLSPGAASAGGGTVISAPSASNIGAVQAAQAGGAGGGAGTSKVAVVNGGAGGGGGSSTYTSYFQSSSTAVSGGGAGGAGGAGAGGAGAADAIDSSTLRATGTFSNKGTAIGSPKAARANMASSSSGYSANYMSNAQSMGGYGSGQGSPGGAMGSSSYDRTYMASGSGGGGIPDYDLPLAGTMQSGQSYSTSTLNTHYNYQGSANGNTSTGRFRTSKRLRLKSPPPTTTTTHKSVFSVLVDRPNRGDGQALRHEPYSTMLKASGDQRFVDRSEDMTIEYPPTQMLAVRTGASIDGHDNYIDNEQTVMLHTDGPSAFAAYKSGQDHSSGSHVLTTTSKKEVRSSYNTLTTDRSSHTTRIEAETPRKSSLQIQPTYHANDRRDSYETVLDSYVDQFSSTANLLPDNGRPRKGHDHIDVSKDNLYESTTTITSTLRSNSMDNSLCDLDEIRSNVTDNTSFNLLDEVDVALSGTVDIVLPGFDDLPTSVAAKGSGNLTAERLATEPDNDYASIKKSYKLERQTNTNTDRRTSFDVLNFSIPEITTNQTDREEVLIEESKHTILSKQAGTRDTTPSGEGSRVAVTPGSAAYSQSFDRQTSATSQTNTIRKTSQQSYKSSQITEITSHSDIPTGPDYDLELDKSVTALLTDIEVDPARWTELNTRKGSIDSIDVGDWDWQVQNLKTVTMNKQGQYVLTGGSGAGGVVTPGAAADEVRVDCCLMTGNGRNVVTGSSLGPPQVWDMQTGELINICKGDAIGSTNLHLVCGDRLLVGAVHADMEINEYSGRKGVFNHTLQIWDFNTGKPLSMAEGEYCSAMCPMHNDNDKVLFGRTDKFGDATSILAWDLMGNQMVKEMRYDAPVGNNDYISYLNLSQSDRYIVAGFTNSFDNNAEFMVFDMNSVSYNIPEPAMLKLDANPDVTVILPNDEAVTGLRNGDLVVWSIRNGQPSRQLLGNGGAHAHSREVKALALSKDNRYLVSASADGTLKVWDMNTERPIHTLMGHSDEVGCASISPDNEIVVSGSSDGTIRLWRMKGGTEMCVFNCGVDIFQVTMSHDKGTIVALGDKYGARKLIMLQVVRTKIKKIVSS